MTVRRSQPVKALVMGHAEMVYSTVANHLQSRKTEKKCQHLHDKHAATELGGKGLQPSRHRWIALET